MKIVAKHFKVRGSQRVVDWCEVTKAFEAAYPSGRTELTMNPIVPAIF